MIQQRSDLVAFGGKKKKDQEKKMIDIERYWVNLNRPPIRYYVQDWVLQRLHDYTTSARLMNNPVQMFKLTNELLAPWGFRPLASGTNRRAFYCEYDPGIIFKIGYDVVGKAANLNEYYLQNMVRPFCSKVFDVAPEGLVSLSERVEEMTEKLYKEVWASDIFDFLVTLLKRGFIMDDVGSNFYKNLGIRMGFGPVLIDFSDLYKLDPRKIKCSRIDPITKQVCRGDIDYDYDNGMSQIICTKCGARYSAKYLGEQVPAEVLVKIETEREIDMTKNVWTVSVVKGDGTVVHEYPPETSYQQVSHNQVEPKVVVINGQMSVEPTKDVKQEVVVEQQNQIVGNPYVVRYSAPQNVEKQPDAPQQEASVSQHNQNVVNPYVVHGNTGNMAPQQVAPSVAAQVNNKIQQTGVVVDNATYQAMCSTFNNGDEVSKEYKEAANAAAIANSPAKTIISGPVITKEMRAAAAGPIPMPTRETVQAKDGTKLNLFSPEEMTKAVFKAKAEGQELPTNIIETAPPVAINNEGKFSSAITPMHTVGHVREYEHYYVHGKKLFFYPKNIHSDLIMWLRKAEDKYGIEAVELIAQKLEILYIPKEEHDKAVNERKKKPIVTTVQTSTEKIETVIAPPKEPKLLNVEKPEDWKSRNSTILEVKNDKEEDKGVIAEENRPTENLYPVKPKTREEIEEEDAKQNSTGNIMGFPGTPVVDSIRFKNSMPIIKKSVENLFGSIVLSQDADRQCDEISQRIKEFIRKDVVEIMNDKNAEGLVVEVTRTVDNRNVDCFNVKASDYGTPLFETQIYPDNGAYDQQLEESLKENQEAVLNPELLTALFEEWIKDLGNTQFTSVEEAKAATTAYLFSKLHDHFKGKIPVARAQKEVEDYVANVINFNEKKVEEVTKETTTEESSVESQL